LSDDATARTLVYVPELPQNMNTSPGAETAGDAALLDAYARRGCEASFRRLVERHAGLVFHTAQRVVEQAALAQDVAQQVFLHLAREAGNLDASRGLAGWLHRTTTFAAMNARRSERRQQKRLQRLARETDTAPDAAWQEVMPLLDAGLESLGGTDRQVVLLHFYEGLAFREVAARLGMSAEAAQKRSVRAVEKLSRWLRRRGVATSSAALGLALTTHMSEAAPMGMAAALAHKSLALTASGGAASAITSFIPTMAFAKLTTAAAVAAFLIPIGWQWRENARAATARAAQRDAGDLSRNVDTASGKATLNAGSAPTAAPAMSSLSPRLAELATALARLSSADDRLGLLKVKRLILELSAEELEGAFRLVKSVSRPVLSLSLAETVFARWGEIAPLEGLAMARDPAVREWRATRCREAGLESEQSIGLFQSWALHDTASALAAAQAWDADFAAPDNRQTAEVPSLLAHLAAIRPQEAMACALRLPDGDVRDLAETLVRQAWTESDPAEALRWAMANTSPDDQPVVLGKIMNQMAGTHPQRAVELAQTLENPHARREAAQFALIQITPYDPRGAMEAMLRLPDEMLTTDLVRHVAMFTSWGDAHIAAEFAPKLPEGERRDIYVAQIARSWWSDDHEACRAWLTTDPVVTPAVRELVLKDLEKTGVQK
jgi:RNA polymerase sigma factor (sigma-70 family)